VVSIQAPILLQLLLRRLFSEHMFGFRFIKFSPTSYVLEFAGGRIKRRGTGLAFLYFAPATTLVQIPIGSTDAPFIFTEVTADFQEVTVQGNITYRITDAQRIAALLDFSLDRTGKHYASEDPKRLEQRVLNALQVEVKSNIGVADLRAAIQATPAFTTEVVKALRQVQDLESLGIEVLSLSIIAIKPQPETARALEADARELLLKNADVALYSRRNASIEQERGIRENELNTEIAVENKKRQIREEQLKAERFEQAQRLEMKRIDLDSNIELERQRKTMVELEAENTKASADARAYATAVLMKAFAEIDEEKLDAIFSAGSNPAQVMAQAFKQLGGSAEKIGELNISPDLLREIMRGSER
jgi:hypothetical protein